MSNNSLRLNALFQLYLEKTITKQQYNELLALIDPDTIDDSLNSTLKEFWFHAKNNQIAFPDEIWDEKIKFLLQQIDEQESPVVPIKKIPTWYKLRWAAAVLLFLLSSGVYFLVKPSKSPSISKNNSTKRVIDQGVLPGGNKAVLILADGTSIVLDSASDGTIASQGATKVVKLGSGQLVYNSSDAGPAFVSYNTLTTPRGGQYQVTLQDGTIVWLNSGSSLRYPTVFIGNERKVEISGEAYFEVAKNERQSFKVKINILNGEGGEVVVLGTHFNINAYNDESTVRTTLFEGSVQINGSTGSAQIKPGQQFQSGSAGQTKIVNDVNLEEVIAWKEGRFQFENADITDVMRQLERWYDIDVSYTGDITQHLGGRISRNVNMLKVLNMLELTGVVNFKVEGKKVLVMP